MEVTVVFWSEVFFHWNPNLENECQRQLVQIQHFFRLFQLFVIKICCRLVSVKPDVTALGMLSGTVLYDQGAETS